MKLIPGVHDEAIAVLKAHFASKPLRWTKTGRTEYRTEFGGKSYRLFKNADRYFLYTESTGGVGGFQEMVKPYTKESAGFFRDGFGRTLTQAKTNAQAWVQRGVTINDDEWED